MGARLELSDADTAIVGRHLPQALMVWLLAIRSWQAPAC